MTSSPSDTLDEIDEEWWLNPPDDLEGQLTIFNARLDHLQDKTPEGQELRAIFLKLNNEAEALSKQAKEDCPIAFMRLGWEQALKCNSWVWGIGFDVDFDANRKGKTCCSIINAILYILPNDPHWKMFSCYTDDWGRIVQVLQRPTAQKILKIRNYLKEHPETAEHFKRLRNRPVLAARQTVNRAIQKDSDIAFRYLERKRRKEFGPHQVIEGDGIRPILVMHEGDVRLQSVAKKRSIKI